MNKKDARAEGEDRGYSAGIYGTEGFKTEDEFFSMAYESEDNARQVSPFEFFAHDVNECEDRADGLWEAYDEGVTAGIKKAWKERGKVDED